ncbi:hypothetical protein SASPL_122901 [Salvia splendens]|uniref:Glycerol-3-phosphate acyltransferase RAM2/GPAT1-8 HAD-like domain-containing protein n=1 Tax=Salvia splendens TaxID=180675 RepID=A0A8X8XNV0_SALSN|nr:hypothetical protein SASPL_122901 [Salvia splendens]
MTAAACFRSIHDCASTGRENDAVVADMDGTLLRGRSSFPYFTLVAFEAGGALHLLFLLFFSPLAGFLYYFISESAGIRVLIFAAFAGLRVSDIESVARAVLPKFYSEDLHPESRRVYELIDSTIPESLRELNKGWVSVDASPLLPPPPPESALSLAQ